MLDWRMEGMFPPGDPLGRITDRLRAAHNDVAACRRPLVLGDWSRHRNAELKPLTGSLQSNFAKVP